MKANRKCLKIVLLLSIISYCEVVCCYAQKIKSLNPTLPTPAVPTVTPIIPQYNFYGSAKTTDQVNKEMIDRDIQQYQVKYQQQEELKDAYQELGVSEKVPDRPVEIKINYSLSGSAAKRGQHFESAFQEISQMLNGKIPSSLKRAVFLTEFAFDTTLSYAQFERQISKLTNVIGLEMKQRKIASDDNLGKIMTLYKLMCDTIRVRNPTTEKMITSYPRLYDFEDFYGMRDYSKMFVSKLIRTGTGQCHSLPLLFLILSEEIGAKAYLSFAPEHSYVKFVDKNGALQNIELTNRMFTTDQFILQSGYITSSAIKSRIYMDTLSLPRIINSTLNDLANSYVKKYGYDEFVLRCAQKVVSFDSKSIQGYMHLSNYYNMLGRSVESQYQVRNINRQYYIQTDDDFRAIISQAIKYGKLIDNLGYAEMPPEMYSNWLSSLKNESLKQQHIQRKQMLNTMIEH